MRRTDYYEIEILEGPVLVTNVRPGELGATLASLIDSGLTVKSVTAIDGPMI